MRIEIHLNCHGYFGFGGGWDMIHNQREPTGQMIYCSADCQLSQTCWELHRQRCADLFPDAFARFEELLARIDHGPTAVEEYFKLYDQAPAEMLVNGGNVEDGGRVAAGQGVADRGRASLPYPFPKERVK
jgi:hypothetical protein